MKLLRGILEPNLFHRGSVVTIGNFDGVHRGHQTLLENLKAVASQKQLPLVVVLFEPQPAEYFNPTQAPARIYSLREKLHHLRQLGIDYAYFLRFNHDIALMSAQGFVTRYLMEMLHTKYLLVGYDFRFGNQRQGDVDLLHCLLSPMGVEVVHFSDFNIENQRVSSTAIRQALRQGHLHQAAKLLGRPYSMCGRVVSGAGTGRAWGIPTANIKPHRVMLPLQGVFCVQVTRANGSRLKGVANVGNRPTVDGVEKVLEVHLFDFNESFYGEMLEVNFLVKLRDEMKFPTVEVLIAQIHDDIRAAKALHQEIHPLVN